MTSSTFDDANRLTARGATTYSYDDDGNLTSDGAQTYAWNARGELTGLSGGSPTASFAYDAFGRRRQATIGATTTSYRYDGDNAIVETQGSSSVRTLAGLGIDSALTRTDGSGTEALLIDALGSTVALTNGSGAVQTEYSYDPFGTPSVSGTSSANPTQFTGREWDGTGLQYSRARYYSPSMGRFISEDPLGFAGGDANVYAYVGDDPLNGIDPSGRNAITAGEVSAGARTVGSGARWVPVAGVGIWATTVLSGPAGESVGCVVYCSSQDDWVVNGDPYYVTDGAAAVLAAKYPPDLPLNRGPWPFVPPRQPSGKVKRDPRGRYLDEDKNGWEWRGDHLDVQHPDGSHTNVRPDGEVHHGQENFPRRPRPRKSKSG